MKRIALILLSVAALLQVACSSAPQQAAPKAVAHYVTISFQNSSCTTATPCTGQIYRAAANCPSGGGINGPTWTQIVGNITGSVTTSNTSFTYNDTGVANGQTYCYYATNIYINTPADGPSGPSNTFQVQTPSSPNAPSNLTGTVN